MSDSALRVAFDRATVAVCERVWDVRAYVDAGLADSIEALRGEAVRRGLVAADDLDHGGPHGMPFLFDSARWGAS